jgi:hypothetical protein
VSRPQREGENGLVLMFQVDDDDDGQGSACSSSIPSQESDDEELINRLCAQRRQAGSTSAQAGGDMESTKEAFQACSSGQLSRQQSTQSGQHSKSQHTGASSRILEETAEGEGHQEESEERRAPQFGWCPCVRPQETSDGKETIAEPPACEEAAEAEPRAQEPEEEEEEADRCTRRHTHLHSHLVSKS